MSTRTPSPLLNPFRGDERKKFIDRTSSLVNNTPHLLAEFTAWWGQFCEDHNLYGDETRTYPIDKARWYRDVHQRGPERQLCVGDIVVQRNPHTLEPVQLHEVVATDPKWAHLRVVESFEGNPLPTWPRTAPSSILRTSTDSSAPFYVERAATFPSQSDLDGKDVYELARMDDIATLRGNLLDLQVSRWWSSWQPDQLTKMELFAKYANPCED